MEATGRYWDDLAMWAYKLGWKVTVVNPRCIRSFAESRLKYNKTDKLDAECILLFAEGAREGDLRQWHPRSAAERELKELQMGINGLAKEIGQQQNRLKSGIKSAALKDSIKRTIEFLQKQKTELEIMAMQLIKGDPKLLELYKILRQIKGFGDKTIRMLIARIDFDSFTKGRQLVSYAGLGTATWESGKSVRKKGHISRVGHADLRCGLYFPAVVAMTHDPEMIQLRQRLEGRKKESKEIICAVMATLLRKAFALVRNARKQEAAMVAAAEI